MSIGTDIPRTRTAGGCGPKKPSKKMKRRRAQAKVRAKRRASGYTKPPAVSRRKREAAAAGSLNYNTTANVAPAAANIEATANTPSRTVIRRRTVHL